MDQACEGAREGGEERGDGDREVSIRISLWLPILVMAGIFLLSAIPGGSLPGSGPLPHADKIVHMGLFGGLLLSFRPRARHGLTLGEWLPFGVAASLSYALADEIHQHWVPGRVPDGADLLADAGGIAGAALLCALRRPSRS
ncbi:MAG: VanZ family protein [Planctomycetota bacterium]